jgi:hypothetical protein
LPVALGWAVVVKKGGYQLAPFVKARGPFFLSPVPSLQLLPLRASSECRSSSDELLDFCQAALENRPLRIGNLEFTFHVMQVYEAALCSRGNPVAIE